jgi:NitT/TauT family transport system substrate-binding protein
VTRRGFIRSTSALGAAAALGIPTSAAAEPPPEVKKIRLVRIPAICLAPQYLAEEILRLEGFTDIQYYEIDRTISTEILTENLADMTVTAPPELMPALDRGAAILILAGIHGGCFELLAHDHIRAVHDLKGKRIAVNAIGSLEYYFLASMLAYVGIDPKKEVEWLDSKTFERVRQDFVEKRADAFLAFPPDAQELREKKIGHVIVNTAQDRPWEPHYCCMLSARSDFVRRYPVATKRAVRALLKAADICASDPERAAKYVVAKEIYPRYDIALDVMNSVPYKRWRTHNPEDSLRFVGLRLYEAGMIKTNPQKLIDQGTDWRFLNELKRELKA